ncbi:unnamed protein product [Rhizopus stolonifer]
MTQCHVPYLSEDEKVFLNTAATCSQARRMSNTENRPSIEENKKCQTMSSHSLHFFWKRRGSAQSSAGSVDCLMETEEAPQQSSAKAKELEMLIFDQPQRTVRLSLTPRCAA